MLTRCLIVFTLCMALCLEFSSAGECIICDSNIDPNCAQKPENISPQKCTSEINVTTCYTRLVKGQTYRGCFNELDGDLQNMCRNDNMGVNCTMCENLHGAKDCNNLVYPGHRLTCHHCSGDTKSKCFAAPEENALPCKTYNEEDKCFIWKTSKGIERGCLSDTMHCTNVSHCRICDGNGCNNDAGSNPNIPIAPNSAAALTMAISTIFIAVVISLNNN